jgi:hypothetical protein
MVPRALRYLAGINARYRTEGDVRIQDCEATMRNDLRFASI